MGPLPFLTPPLSPLPTFPARTLLTLQPPTCSLPALPLRSRMGWRLHCQGKVKGERSPTLCPREGPVLEQDLGRSRSGHRPTPAEAVEGQWVCGPQWSLTPVGSSGDEGSSPTHPAGSGQRMLLARGRRLLPGVGASEPPEGPSLPPGLKDGGWLPKDDRSRQGLGRWFPPSGISSRVWVLRVLRRQKQGTVSDPAPPPGPLSRLSPRIPSLGIS